MASTEVTPITINDRLYRTVKEGQATILAPYRKETGKPKKGNDQSGAPRNNDEGDQAVFYNPIQQYNRDLSVLAILVYGESAVFSKKTKHEKTQGRSKKRKNRKGHPDAKPDAGEAVQAGTTAQAIDSGHKRKADEAELEVLDAEAESRAKRVCDENDHAQDELEVQQLNGVAESSKFLDTDKPQEAEVTSSLSKSSQSAEKRVRPAPFTILDALSASGLRAIRYAKEIPFSTTVVANDLLPEAVEAIKLNIEHNKVEEKVFANVGDARQFMYSKTGNESSSPGPSYVHRFDVIDLDPYGSATQFIDAALQAVADGGLLCVTCTDAGVFASNGYPEKAYGAYSGIPLKGTHSHEAGLRLILHSIATAASKYAIAIEPLLSLSIDFYARLFIRVHKSQQDVKLMAGTTMLVYNCDQGCGAWQTQLVARNQSSQSTNNQTFYKHSFSQAPSVDKHCEHCGSKTHLGGPMWAGPLHNPAFVQRILNKLPTLDKTVYGTTDRIRGMLTVALEEETFDFLPKPEVGNASSTTMTNGSPSKDAIPGSEALIPRMPPQLLSPSPLFFQPTYLAKVLSSPSPAEDPFRGAFLSLGYTCTRSHCKPGSIKTNAPWKVIWEIMREFVRQKEGERITRLLGQGEFEGKASVKRSSPGWHILRRVRGRDDEALRAARAREDLMRRLGFGIGSAEIESVSDLQGVLKSALFDLEHPSVRAVGPLTKAQPSANGADQRPESSDVSGKPEQADGETKRANGDITIDVSDGHVLVAGGQITKISGKQFIESGGDPSELEIVFDAELGRAWKQSNGTNSKLVRYQINPRANWGPMHRAGKGS